MGTLRVSDPKYTDTLSAGNQLTIVTAASSTALVERYDGGAFVESETMAASTTLVIGEFKKDYQFHITALTGSLTYVEAPSANQSGEFKTSTVAAASAVSETTATPVDVTSLSLTAGDWEVSAQIDRTLSGVTATIYGGGLGVATATLLTQAGGSGVGTDCLTTQTATFGTTLTGRYDTKIGPVRVSLSATTTIYLIAADTFSAGTVAVFGTLRARRVR